ncbi:single-stranded DNA-binding protein [Texcoconibacillus texcoconensis]|uniref:Single-stranded DNA-binding protein n=1 Tax=Texcoconibacillus texcoconensis TaxID=1095777 RepID=A0A840QTS0_9BACI|nr:single-stranded DNA-binding protein [Texcoconibacillus texcoconensis]MBB5174764.1 single-strand DNA-binding protein [Texcoconibacillus texcoconensis]
MINRVVLVGRLTKDPELRYTANGIAVTSFTLAVNRPFSNQQGNREADFINCVVWRKQAENVANYLKKGSQAGVDGRMQTRSYENQEGRRIFVTEVVAESVQFLEPKNASGGGGFGSQESYGNPSPSPNPYEPANDGFQRNQGQAPGSGGQKGQTDLSDDPFASDGKPIDISDDDLPF